MLFLASCFSDRVSNGIYLSNFYHIYSVAVLIVMYFKKRLSHRHALNGGVLVVNLSGVCYSGRMWGFFNYYFYVTVYFPKR